MSTIIVFIIILSVLIFVHELGHFITAKKSGIVVEEFAIGYPPRAVKLWQDEGKLTLDGREMIIGRKTTVPKGLQVGAHVAIETAPRPDGRTEISKIEVIDPDQPGDGRPVSVVENLEKPTEYTLNWIPFGGYVKMLGEEDPTASGSFASKSKRVRFTVLVAGAVMNLITAVIIFTIMFMTGQPEPIGPTFITEVVPNSPAAVAGIQANDVVLKADDTLIESSQDLVDYTGKHKGEEIILTLLRDGSELQVSIVPRKNPPPGEGAMGVGIQTQYTQLRVTEVSPDSPAAQMGLQVDDIIERVDGNIIGAPALLIQYLESKQGEATTVSILRGEATLNKTFEPVIVPSVELDPMLSNAISQPIPAIGAVVAAEFLEQRITRLPPGEALLLGAASTTRIVVQTFTIPVAIIKNIIPAEQARPVGPFGIYQITDSAVEVSRESNQIYPILFLAAILSTALAVTNLLPLPALDGGRILFIIVEAIRGKRVSPEKEGLIHFVGLALLFTLMIVISYYDLTDPVDTSGLFK